MKKLLTLTAIGAIIATPATAVQKCVVFDADNTYCDLVGGIVYNELDWAASCTTNGVSMEIKGISSCSDVAGSKDYDITDTLHVNSSDITKNVNCWCKMVSPAVSKWVFYFTETSASKCAETCGYGCKSMAAYGFDFRSVAFSNLSD